MWAMWQTARPGEPVTGRLNRFVASREVVTIESVDSTNGMKPILPPVRFSSAAVFCHGWRVSPICLHARHGRTHCSLFRCHYGARQAYRRGSPAHSGARPGATFAPSIAFSTERRGRPAPWRVIFSICWCKPSCQPHAPIVIGLDDTIERRWGAKIKARGIYRDPVRSSKGHFVKTSGLRWLSAMLLVHVPWAGRIMALPFLTLLAPSKRFYKDKRREHKTIVDWARQAVLQIHRWLPGRYIVMVADSAFAASGVPRCRRQACLRRHTFAA